MSSLRQCKGCRSGDRVAWKCINHCRYILFTWAVMLIPTPCQVSQDFSNLSSNWYLSTLPYMLFCTGLEEDKEVSVAQLQNMCLDSLFDIRSSALYWSQQGVQPVNRWGRSNQCFSFALQYKKATTSRFFHALGFNPFIKKRLGCRQKLCTFSTVRSEKSRTEMSRLGSCWAFHK